jgi:hypothetical protein
MKKNKNTQVVSIEVKSKEELKNLKKRVIIL